MTTAWWRRRGVWLLALTGLSVALWFPRRFGPLDMRYDAGVYYILGTSLAEGRGYRILSEPGAIEAIQYPPGLSVIAAAAQKVAGTTDADTVGHLLRIGFAGMFLLLGFAIFFMAVRYVPPPWAAFAAAVTLLQGEMIFLSDLFFAELPYALVTVLFFVVVPRAVPSATELPRSRLRRALAGGLAVVGYLLRTAGVALFVAWVAEALLRRRIGRAALRAMVALMPLVAWQAYTVHVKHSEAYRHPAYPYQRAGYQFYNVSYLDNLIYKDPFIPEQGLIGPADTGPPGGRQPRADSARGRRGHFGRTRVVAAPAARFHRASPPHQAGAGDADRGRPARADAADGRRAGAARVARGMAHSALRRRLRSA